MTELGERLCGERTRLGLSQQKLAEMVGVDRRAIGRYEKDINVPGGAILAEFAKLGADVHYVLTGERESNARALTVLKEEKAADEAFASIPLYNVEASAGHGSLVEHEQVERMLIFRKDWIRNELHVNPNDLYLVSVQGDSMYPTISPNDVILVHDDKDAAIVPCDGIYLLRLDGSLLVKRLQRKPNNKVVVMSDNPSYAAFEVDVDAFTDADFCIIGRVVWSGRKM